MSDGRQLDRLLKWIVPAVILVAAVGGLFASRLIGITNEQAAGECAYILGWQRCWQVPLHTFAAATGLALPRGTIVQSSESDGWDFFHHLEADGDLILSPGAAVPRARCTAPLGKPVTRLREPDAVSLESQWKSLGATHVVACEFGTYNDAAGWLGEAVSASGRVQIHVEIEVTQDWSNNGPVSSSAPAPAAN